MTKIELAVMAIKTKARDAEKLCDPKDRTPYPQAIQQIVANLHGINEECEKILE